MTSEQRERRHTRVAAGTWCAFAACQPLVTLYEFQNSGFHSESGLEPQTKPPWLTQVLLGVLRQTLTPIPYFCLTNLICMNFVRSFFSLPGTDKTSTRSSAFFWVTIVVCTIGFPFGSLASVFHRTVFDSSSQVGRA